ncbi:hypothetical protein SAMD00023353_6000500 [Rosellinia necatrix]|uniref:Uncharacterized protein n=1 Tax=Rosellinia necatrix TaxID=77044 RepID=A0A1W2TS47_ROSNE|nr:hypothetical protein SAMD00023353_6000500 [Rosellinia necatrix]
MNLINKRTPDAVLESPNAWESARQQLDMILYNATIWSTELTEENLNNISEDDTNLISILDGLVTSLAVISHRLTHLTNVADTITDLVLLTVGKNLKQTVKDLENRIDSMYDDCPQCELNSPLAGSLDLKTTLELEYLDQINSLVLDLQQDSRPLQFVLKRRGNRLAERLRREAPEALKADTMQIGSCCKTTNNMVVPNLRMEPQINSSASHIMTLESKHMGENRHRSPEMLQSLSNGVNSLIERWGKVKCTFDTVMNQWDPKELGLGASESLCYSHMLLLMSTDATIFERSNIPRELDQILTGLRNRAALQTAPCTAERLAAKVDGTNTSLTGDNLPRDIVTRLIEAVPGQEDGNAAVELIPDLLRIQQQLYAACSLLRALPTWVIHVRGDDVTLAERLMHATQATLIDQVIVGISSIMNAVAPRVHNAGYSMLIYQISITLTLSATQLLQVSSSPHMATPWSEITPTLGVLAMEAQSFVAHLASVLGLKMDNHAQNILALPPVHFLVYVPGGAEMAEIEDNADNDEFMGDETVGVDDVVGDEVLGEDDDINPDSFVTVSAGVLLEGRTANNDVGLAD